MTNELLDVRIIPLHATETEKEPHTYSFRFLREVGIVDYLVT